MSNRIGTRLGSTLAICTGTAGGAAAAARDAASSLPHAVNSATAKSASTQYAAAIDAGRWPCAGMVFLLGDMSGESLEKQGRVGRAPRAIITQSLRDRRRGAGVPARQRPDNEPAWTQRLRRPRRRGYHAMRDRRYDNSASKGGKPMRTQLSI